MAIGGHAFFFYPSSSLEVMVNTISMALATFETIVLLGSIVH